MRNLSVLLVTSALAIFAVGCKPGPNATPFGNMGGTNMANPGPVNNPNPSPFNNPNPAPFNNNNNGGGLTGTYHINTEHFNMQLHGQTPPKEQLDQLIAQLKQTFAAITLTLNADGTFQCSGGAQTSTGHYSVNGSTIQFQEDQPSGQPLPQVTIANGGSMLQLHIETQAAGIDLELMR